MSELFDLNIEQVLENWSISDALREIIANALDEQILTQTKDIRIYKDNNIWHIRDFGRGIQYRHFTQNENEEKNNSNKLIGKFGVGLKDALAVFYRHGCTVSIESKHHKISTEMAPKIGFDITTLHAKFEFPINSEMVGTDFAISGVSDKDIEEAKSRFIIFNSLKKLETTKWGEVYSCDTGVPSIYINGVKVAEENNFMFNYNITTMNAQIRKSLNRERSNVGRTAYADTIKNILKSCKSNEVLFSLVDDLKNRMRGTNKDEIAWVDIATYVVQTLNKDKNVVFMTPNQRDELTNEQREILINSGKKLILITDDVFNKTRGSVEIFEDVYNDYMASFKFKFVDYCNLTRQEKEVFNLKEKIFKLLKPKFEICKRVLISETICPDEFGGKTLGLYNGDDIIILRETLSDPIEFCGVLAHELCHCQHDFTDNTREFENDLTDMLGFVIYKKI